jgi:predicted DNA-binding transcriptional regulator YafY
VNPDPTGADLEVQTARPLNLIALLSDSRRGLTKEQIKEHLQLGSDAVFEELKAEVRGWLGVEILEEDSRYRIVDRGYAMPPLDLTAAEHTAIALALREWSGSDVGEVAEAASAKLAPLGGGQEDVSPGLDLTIYQAAPGAAEILAGIADRRVVEFDYRTGYSGRLGRRRVEPWHLTKRAGAFYFAGWDKDREDKRVFRLDRVDGKIKLTGRADAFDPPAGQARQYLYAALERGQGEPARLRATPEAARVLVLEGGVALPDGELSVPEADPFRLAGWGGAIEVLAPDGLRQAVRDCWIGVERSHQGAARPVKPYPVRRVSRVRRTSVRHRQRAVRLISIISYLNDRDWVTLDELASAFGVDRDTIRADLDMLWTRVGRGEAGGELVDFVFSDDRSEVTLTDPQGLGKPVQFSRVEAIALVAALRALKAMAGLPEASAAQTACEKLEAAIGPVDQADVELPAAPPALGSLRQAIESQRRVRFTYVKQGGQFGERLVDPVGLFAAPDHWLLVAWDLGAEAERYFRVDRLTDVEILTQSAQRHPYQPRASGWSGRGDLLVDLLFGPGARRRALDLETAVPPLALKNGAIQAKVAVDNPEWVTRLVLEGGGSVELLAPPEMRQHVRLAAQAALGSS